MSDQPAPKHVGKRILAILKHIGKSILAILAGFVVVVAISIGTDTILELTGVLPKFGTGLSDSQALLATVYRTIYGVLGSYITARIAPNKPMMHALIGGAIGMVIATIGAAVTWKHVPPLAPHWYAVSLIIGALPTAWLGAQIHIMLTGSKP